MSGVGIRQWSLTNSLGHTRAAFVRSLLGEHCGLQTAPALPLEMGSFRTQACIGAVTRELPSPRSPAHGSDTRQLRLGRAGLEQLVPELDAALAEWGPTRVALVMGTSTGGILDSEAAYRHRAAEQRLPADYSCRLGHAFDGAPRQIAREFGISGPVYVVSTACSSAGKALAAAKRLIDCGVCDAALVGGVDTLCRLTLMGFASLGVLAGDPCQPFQEASPGMNVAEGAAWLLLDRRAGRVALLGAGESSDAYHMVTPHPDGLGAALAMERALIDAGAGVGDIDYVNAHGTGTRANDAGEERAITQVLGDVPFTSTKNLHGHQLGATAATEAIVCAELVLRPRLDHYPGMGRQTSRPRVRNMVLSNSFAFGGSNVSLVFGPHQRSAEQGQAPLRAFIRSLGFWSPGVPNASALAAGSQPAEPAGVPEARLLPARQRGRAPALVRMCAEVIEQLAPIDDLGELPLVYGSAFGPVHNTLSLLDQQQQDECSPLRFQNSVHNVAQGMLSMTLSNRGFSTAVTASENTLAAAILEALCWLGMNDNENSIAVVVGDEPPPVPLLDERYPPMCAGFVLARQPAGALAQIELEPTSSRSARPWPTVPEHSELAQNPVGQAATLLWCVKNAQWGTYRLGRDDSAWQPALRVGAPHEPDAGQ